MVLGDLRDGRHQRLVHAAQRAHLLIHPVQTEPASLWLERRRHTSGC